jgi:hypothetical protein
MNMDRYMLLMLKSLSGRGSLFLFVRTHHHLGFYFNLADTQHAANQGGLIRGNSPPPSDNVVEIHPVSRAASQPQ